MATIKGPLSGKILSDASPDGRKPAWDTEAPQREQVMDWVMHDEHEQVQSAFDRFDLPTTNLLHYANSASMVDRLVGFGADVNQTYHDFRELDPDREEPVTDHSPYTPLQMAVAREKPEAFDRLLEHGADFEIGGDQRPLMLAVDRPPSHGPEFARMAETLLDLGARVHTEPGEKPVLNLAVENNQQVPLVKRLLDSGADPQQGFDNEGTPLHHVKDTQPGVSDLLLDYGANKNTPKSDEDPMTPLESAMLRGQVKTVGRLIEREADVAQVVHSENWARAQNSNPQRIREAGIREAAEIVHVEYEKRTLRQAAAEATHEQEQAPVPRKIRQRM